MNNRATEFLVGLFVLIAIGALLMLALQVSNVTNLVGSNGYQVKASFDNIGGLRVRAPVSASGVRVGRVTDISYDPETFEAHVTLTIDAEYDAFPLDTSASIYTAGLLGEQYIGLEPGAEDDVLADGDEISLTQSAVVLERLISQAVFARSGQ